MQSAQCAISSRIESWFHENSVGISDQVFESSNCSENFPQQIICQVVIIRSKFSGKKSKKHPENSEMNNS